MKHNKLIFTVIILTLTCLMSTGSIAQTFSSDALIGKWITDENKGVVEIYKWNGKYYGRIISTKDKTDKYGKPLVDSQNPDPALKKRPIIRLEILKDFEFDGGNVWTNGTVYDPESGKTYSSKITMKDKNTLDLRGYIGISMIGRSTIWKRKLD